MGVCLRKNRKTITFPHQRACSVFIVVTSRYFAARLAPKIVWVHEIHIYHPMFFYNHINTFGEFSYRAMFSVHPVRGGIY